MSDHTASLPQVKICWIVWTLLAFAIFAVIAAYSSRMTATYTDDYQQRASARYVTLQKLRDEATQTLTTVDWVDQSKGIIRIPIDEAMTREIADLKNKPAALGGPIAVPAPATPSAPASTNAAPAAPAQEAKK